MLDRPARLNALDLAVRHALLGCLRQVADDPGVRAVVLTGTGRAFCAGQDLAAAEELVRADETVAGAYNSLAHAISAMPKPVIAAVNGLAVGAGLGLALACDVRLAADDATFSCAFGKVGLVPDTGTSWVLVRELGYARAYELATSGRSFTAQEAQAWGLINHVVPSGDLARAARDCARELAAGPTAAFALTKAQFRAAAELSLDATLAIEARHQGIAARHPDHAEGRLAFREKRPARWA